MISLNDVLLAMSNIPVDDPIAEIWGRQMQGGYKIIEYTGSLPITINANGDALLDYRIYGASGGVGVRTENLFDKNATNTDNGFIAHAYVDRLGNVENYWSFNVSEYISIKPNTAYYAQNVSSTNVSYCSVCFYTADHTFISAISYTFRIDIPFTTPANAAYIRMSVRIANLDIITLTEGTEPPTSYIPYGYKLPMTVSDGNTTQSVPVYIGENQLDSVEGVSDYVNKSSGKIVRMIGEYTFTGEELVTNCGEYGACWFYSNNMSPKAMSAYDTITMRCDHPMLTAIKNRGITRWSRADVPDDVCGFREGYTQAVFRSTATFANAEECKAYMKAQYDNGTPVKVSYWLETPIEEDPPVPLPEIPTIDGTTVIDYDGTPKPSQMYVKYKGNG